MKSLTALLAVIVALVLAAPGAPTAHAASPILGQPELIVVIGPFPLEVFDGSRRSTPDTGVSGTSGYVNLGFVEVDTSTGEAWPYGFGAIFTRAQQRAAIDAAGDAS